MPKILTDKYRNATFFIPYATDKSEGVFVMPMTETRKNALRKEVAQESGQDEHILNHLFMRATLKASISGWKGFYDVKGEDIPHSDQMIDEMCECDQDFMAGLMVRILSVARFGELGEEKN